MSDEVTTVSVEAGAQPPKPNKPVKPEGVPDKFWDADKGVVRTEDLAKSYLELEKKQSKAPTEEATDAAKKALEQPTKLDPGSNLAITQDQAKKSVEDAGFDMQALQTEFNEHGKLSEETYKKLEAAKLPKPLVDGYIEGQKALIAKAQAEVLEAVGGKDLYAQAVTWAKENLPPDEVEAFDKSLKGKSLAEIKVQAKGLIARFKAEAGSDPQFVMGGGTPSGTKPYANRDEMVADMSKPEYRKDPEFRAKVRDRLAISKNL
jgi:hypothetical protein